MATTALQAAATASARARDSEFTGTPKVNVFDLLSRCQTILNGMTAGYEASASLPVQPNNPLYSISGLLPNALKIVDVQDSTGRSLDGPIPFTSLKYLSFDWWRQTGPQLYSYSLIGKDLLLLRPQLIMPQTVTVKYIAVTQPLLVDGDLFQVPDEDVPQTIDAVEFLLDMKARDLDNCKAILERLQGQIMNTAGETR